jgi:hypothetical protein
MHALVIDIEDASCAGHLAHEFRMAREIVVKIADARASQFLQQLAYAGEVQLPERDRHSLEHIIVAMLDALERFLGCLKRGDIGRRLDNLRAVVPIFGVERAGRFQNDARPIGRPAGKLAHPMPLRGQLSFHGGRCFARCA